MMIFQHTSRQTAFTFTYLTKRNKKKKNKKKTCSYFIVIAFEVCNDFSTRW